MTNVKDAILVMLREFDKVFQEAYSDAFYLQFECQINLF
jgi:hypothetical protein